MHRAPRRAFIRPFSVDFRARDVLMKLDAVRSFAELREFQQ
jgi:hypothetical protein